MFHLSCILVDFSIAVSLVYSLILKLHRDDVDPGDKHVNVVGLHGMRISMWVWGIENSVIGCGRNIGV